MADSMALRRKTKRAPLFQPGICWQSIVITAGVLLGMWVVSHWYPGCIFRRITGIPCPGCGMTRAISALLEGKFAAAWRYHPCVYELPLIVAFAVCRGKIFASRRANWAMGILLAAAFLGCYGIRMSLGVII